VELRLRQAETDRDNTKSTDKRQFFFDCGAIEVDAEARTLIVPVAWRAASAAEAEGLPTRNAQDALNADAEKKLLGKQGVKAVPVLLAALKANVSEDEAKPQTLLARHLRRYTRRNTSDFFIHKDLRGFLTRELDYWLKAEVLKLDTLLAGGEQPAQAWLQTLACLREVATTIIDFVARIEDFQKKLYEKRKFITACHWCLTLNHVERAGLTERLADILNTTDGGKAQKAEWKHLYAIDEVKAEGGKPGWKEKVSADFLRSQPYLVLDTVHLPQDFTDTLLASFDDLDAATDGLLVHGDNWQALNLLMERYREQVQCVYIDPPYNSKTSEIIYKNTYKHSSWLSLMANRLSASRSLETADGSHVIAIDENEQEGLGHLVRNAFPDREIVCAVVVHNKKGIQGDYFSHNHEYAYFCIKYGLPETHGAPVPKDEWEYTNLRKWGRESERETARNCFYPIYVKEGEIIGFGEVCDENFHPRANNAKDGSRIAVYPVDASGVERKWRYARNSVESIKRLLKVHVTTQGEIQIVKAVDERPIKTLWDDTRYIAGDYGTKWLTDLGLKLREDLYPKSLHVVEDSVRAVSEPRSIILDYFGGSGTTAHAVVSLNRASDRDQRKFVMVEMGSYFDTVLVPRVKKIAYSPDWKDGKPVSRAGSSLAFKYLRLESYEDTLGNLRLRADAPGQGGLDLDAMPEVYRLGYWLDVETACSASLLDVERLERPFDYALDVHDGKATHTRAIDLAETFNYLIGLIVRQRKVLDRDGRRYLLYAGRTRADDADTAVLWRDIAGWTEADFAAERDWIVRAAPFGEASVIYVNGDSAIPGAQSLDPVFHARMFAPVH